MTSNTHVLFPNEAEIIIKSLDIGSIDKIGCKRWWSNHEVIEKLNMQAVINVTGCSDEFIKDFLVSYNKINLLIYDLINSELWNEKIFPHVYSHVDANNTSSLPLYMTMFHEVTVLGLLETSLYYKECCENAGEEIIDLIDYVHRKLTQLLFNKMKEEDVKNNFDDKNREELERQREEIQFTTQIKVISLLRYITDWLEVLPLSALTRILETYDIPCMLVQLLDASPWKRLNKLGESEIFKENNWVKQTSEERHVINKIEGQVWLTLYQLLLHPDCQRKYEFNSYRKTQLLKLRRFMNDLLLDQIGHLRELQRFVETMSLTEAAPVKKELVIEQLPEIRNSIEARFKGQWEDLGQYQAQKYFQLDQQQIIDCAKRLSSTYSLDVLEQMIEEPPKCALCNDEATKRCSKCKNQWYCSRPCQVKDWNSHRQLCSLLKNRHI